eukprot:TRINITY_DN112901_c0_g1_i1.p1 TRINITY_DN112901_c0_g1~~TRINITY_DN112901_c0_g1_i1.p1  ORF type:complete len:382 (-),score=116.84 TRINITY_DN112901_c0_g1_i1:51-1196(-)
MSGYGSGAVDEILSGRVVKLIAPHGKQPFGFISPERGGDDVWFGAHLLGDSKSWDDFKAQVGRYGKIPAPVSYKLDEKGRANGVVVLNLKEVDTDGDDHISEEEMAKYLAAHPEMHQKVKTQVELEREKRQEERDAEHAAWLERKAAKDAAWTKRKADEEAAWKAKREAQLAEDESESKARGELYDRLAKKEDALRAEIDATKKKRDDLKVQVNQLRDDAQKDWERGEKDACKAKQAQANELQEERNQLYKKVDDLYDQLRNVDWSNNEEIFQWVQQHHDRPVDATWFDLHGLEVNFAEQKATELLKAAQTLGVPSVEVITGAGHHSEGGVSKLKQRIWTSRSSLLARAKDGSVEDLRIADYQPMEDADGDRNPGAVLVTF